MAIESKDAEQANAAAPPRPRPRRRRPGGGRAKTAAAALPVAQVDVAEIVSAPGAVAPTATPRRRRGRGGKRAGAAASETRPKTPAAPLVEKVSAVASSPERSAAVEALTEDDQAQKRRSRRGRRGRRGRPRNETGEVATATPATGKVPAPDDALDDGIESRVIEDFERHDADGDVTIIEPEGDEPVEVFDRGRESEAIDDDEEEAPAVSTIDFEPADFGRRGKREMIINVSAGHECRVAILQNGRLEELFIERESTQSHVGNIYKGRVTNVEPSIQAAFIDFGLPKHGFLHVSDVQPQYFPNHAGATEDVGRKIPRHNRPPIQKCFRRGQEVIVQITKEGVGTKGPTLSSYLSIPGRFLVMMPGMSRHGVSRKIEDEAARREMRDVLNELKLPSGMGFILRTAGMGRSKRELQRDLNYLLRLWKTVVERIKSLAAPAELYRESDLVTRAIRDHFTTDFDGLVIDDKLTGERIREFLQIVMPRAKSPIALYEDREPLFHRMGIEAEIERINMRHVPLPSGGSLVIDSTEAMVAIDVNSGRFRSIADAEETALRINVEAAEEIARQLRLRDLGGLIVCDFIDMRLDRNKRKVEGSLREALKKHKERARILRTSAFGLIEMTRQRQGPSILRSLYADCPHCKGTGHVKLPESVVLDVMRTIQLALHHEHVQKVLVTVASDIAYQLLNAKRHVMSQIETETGKTIVLRGNTTFVSDQIECVCEDGRGRQVPVSGSGGTSA